MTGDRGGFTKQCTGWDSSTVQSLMVGPQWLIRLIDGQVS